MWRKQLHFFPRYLAVVVQEFLHGRYCMAATRKWPKPKAFLKGKRHPIWLYVLIDPRDKAVRYIGKARSASARLASHCATKSTKTPVGRWIHELRAEGLLPVMKVIGKITAFSGSPVIDSLTMQAVERLVICLADQKKAFDRLLNVQDTESGNYRKTLYSIGIESF